MYMKIRGLKQFFHWLFLGVGVFSLIMLGITVNTYLSYADEGYGLRMSFDQASLNGNLLSLRFYFENPGGLDVLIEGGNLAMSKQYNISEATMPTGVMPEAPAGENVSVVFWIPLSEPDLHNIQSNQQAIIDLDLELWVPYRYMRTHLAFQATVGVETS